MDDLGTFIISPFWLQPGTYRHTFMTEEMAMNWINIFANFGDEMKEVEIYFNFCLKPQYFFFNTSKTNCMNIVYWRRPAI